MNIQDKKFVFNEIDILYRIQSSVSDRRHLVIIFSGFSTKYDFKNTGKLFKCNVLWIQDRYAGKECYYLGRNKSFEFENATLALISQTLKRYGLSWSECTLLGGSKGGFAALYFGLKYNFKNVVACAFSSLIGKSMVENHPQTANYVMGPLLNKEVQLEYDELLHRVVEQDDILDKNIYLFLSAADTYYIEHQAPMLISFEKYQNFNLIMTESPLVYRHNRVTAYNVPLVTSIILSLIENLVPRYGHVSNGVVGISSEDILERQKRELNNDVIELFNHNMRENYLFMDGVAFIRGYNCPGYGHAHRLLVLRSTYLEYKFPIGATLNIEHTVQYFKDAFCNYTGVGFATIKNKGISLRDIENGCYDVDVIIQMEGVEKVGALKDSKKTDSKFFYKDIEYRIWSQDGKIKLSKRYIVGCKSLSSIFAIKDKWLQSKCLHYEGVFAIKGVELSSWGTAKYYLILKGESHTFSYLLGMVNRSSLNKTIGEEYAIYEKSYFSTAKYAGVLISDICEGSYNVYISISIGGEVFTEDTGDIIECLNTQIYFK